MSSPDAAGRDASGSLPDQTFPKAYRLTSRKQFQEIYRRGQRSTSASLSVFGLPNELPHCRLGITVTRKIGSAVIRNRIKRRLREIFRRHLKNLQPPLDLVVNARPGCPQRAQAELEAEFLGRFAALARRLAS